MAAANTDLFKKGARKWVGQIGSAGVSDASVTTIPLASTTGLPTDTGVEIVIDRVSSSGTKTPSLEETIVGVVSGSNIVSAVRGVEGTAQAHLAGAVVEVLITADMWNDMVDGILSQHSQAGAHTDITATTVSLTQNIDLVDGKGIRDGNDNEILLIDQTASAVNEFTVANAITGTGPILSATGGDTNIDMNLTPKGAGAVIPNGLGIKLTPAPAADHLVSGTIARFVANENQAIGDVCYINGDGEMQLGDADAIATSKIVAICADATISADATGNYLMHGFIRDDTWAWTVGGFIYLTVTGTTGNTLSQTAPSATDDAVVIVGVATHADRMYFNPQLVIVEHA